MTGQLFHGAQQLGGIVLRLRDDLLISVREHGAQPVHVIEDELNSRFYRVGASEYTFLSLLDGETTFADALGRTASVTGPDALTESEAASLCRWLVETGLASTAESRSSARLAAAGVQVRQARIKRAVNPLLVRVPLLNPDPLMRRAAAAFGWLQSWPMFALWLVVVGWGAGCVAVHWREAASTTSSIVSASNWLWLALATVGLKLIHECSHGIACRRQGGPVREAGVTLILFVPLPYIDVTSAWRLDSRWQRMFISAAGMYAELALAGAAAILWSACEPGLLKQHAFNVMFAASAMTLLFNANPLMRFDGYYILCDWLDLPNLASHGQSRLLSLGRRWVLGLPGEAPQWPEGRSNLVLCYGVAALLWRVLICAGLVLAADALYFGAGVVLAAVAVVLWVVLPLARLAWFVVAGSATERPRRRRTALVIAALAVAVLAAARIPCSQLMVAPAVVDFDPISRVRTPVAGFAREVRVHSGQSVRQGDVLVVLQNPELEAQRSQLANELEQTRQRARLAHQRMEIAAYLAEQGDAAMLTSRLEQIDQRLNQLLIRAPQDGLVLDGDVQSLRGVYLSAGDEVVSIGAADDKRLLIFVSEEQIDAFAERTGAPITVHLWGAGSSHPGTLRAADPQATTQILHPALASPWGGPLDVRLTSRQDQGGGDSRYEFAKPHFLTRVEIPAARLTQWAAGRMGYVSFRTSRQTWGERLGRAVCQWWQARRSALARHWSR